MGAEIEPDRSNTPETETARVFFEKAREEAIQRVSQREQGLFLYMTLLAALLGVLITYPTWYPALLVIPFFSLGTTLLLLQHDLVIGILARYQKHELRNHLDRATLLQWERSRSLNEYGGLVLTMRVTAHIGLLVVPSVVSLILVGWLFFQPTLFDRNVPVDPDPKTAPHDVGAAPSIHETNQTPTERQKAQTPRRSGDFDAQDFFIVVMWVCGLIATVASGLTSWMVHVLRSEIGAFESPQGIVKQTWRGRLRRIIRARSTNT